MRKAPPWSSPRLSSKAKAGLKESRSSRRPLGRHRRLNTPRPLPPRHAQRRHRRPVRHRHRLRPPVRHPLHHPARHRRHLARHRGSRRLPPQHRKGSRRSPHHGQHSRLRALLQHRQHPRGVPPLLRRQHLYPQRPQRRQAARRRRHHPRPQRQHRPVLRYPAEPRRPHRPVKVRCSVPARLLSVPRRPRVLPPAFQPAAPRARQ